MEKHATHDKMKGRIFERLVGKHALGLYGGQTQTHPPEAESGAMRRNVVTLDLLLVISSARIRAHSTQIGQIMNINWSRRRDGKITISTHEQ